MSDSLIYDTPGAWLFRRWLCRLLGHRWVPMTATWNQRVGSGPWERRERPDAGFRCRRCREMHIELLATSEGIVAPVYVDDVRAIPRGSR